jgi:hypothetical protein
MSYPVRQPQGYSSVSSFIPTPVLDPTRQLASAMLRRAVIDLGHQNAAIRAEVKEWLQNVPAVRLWCDAIDLNVETFQQRALQHVRETSGVITALCHP